MMSDYKHDEDLLFQQLEEKAALLKQAEIERRWDFVNALITDRDILAYIKSMPEEKRAGWFKRAVNLAFREDEE
ncbi:MAG: hypothetical protein ABSB88_04870 [Bryobacteraceae bacterium]|jgi:hypothetical protein